MHRCTSVTPADATTRVSGAAGTLQINGNGIKVLAPKVLEFDGFSWVAGPKSTQQDIMAREWMCGAPERAAAENRGARATPDRPPGVLVVLLGWGHIP